MIVTDYIKQKFRTFDIRLSEADLLDITLGLDVELTEDNKTRVNVAIVRFIPALLLRAKSINESGFSKSWDIQGVKDYYSMMCKEYGLTDNLNNHDTVTFL
ncbi:DUF6706 family protein [Bacteroides reticulotermitis]|uniref:DUF6706 family protein n=1 Tax=Bacteroides reticulotermitis TaxID=1133319 RepID=UPI003A854400